MDTPSAVTAEEPKPSGRVPAAKDSWADVLGLPVQISVDVRIQKFSVRDLLALDLDTIVDTGVRATDPVPVWANGVVIGSAEFDVLGKRLAIRLNELR
jgi:flagellar motor switch/type III secretory pathway protein FliN